MVFSGYRVPFFIGRGVPGGGVAASLLLEAVDRSFSPRRPLSSEVAVTVCVGVTGPVRSLIWEMANFLCGARRRPVSGLREKAADRLRMELTLAECSCALVAPAPGRVLWGGATPDRTVGASVRSAGRLSLTGGARDTAGACCLLSSFAFRAGAVSLAGATSFGIARAPSEKNSPGRAWWDLCPLRGTGFHSPAAT